MSEEVKANTNYDVMNEKYDLPNLYLNASDDVYKADTKTMEMGFRVTEEEGERTITFNNGFFPYGTSVDWGDGANTVVTSDYCAHIYSSGNYTLRATLSSDYQAEIEHIDGNYTFAEASDKPRYLGTNVVSMTKTQGEEPGVLVWFDDAMQLYPYVWSMFRNGDQSRFEFSGCYPMTSLKIYDNVRLRTINPGAFAGLQKLTTLRLPSTLNVISGDYRVVDEEANSLMIRDYTDTIGPVGAFMGCTSLKVLDLRNCTSLTTIGLNAFACCFSLEKAILPPSVNSMTDVFAGCYNLKTIVFTGAVPPAHYSDTQGTTYTPPTTLKIRVPAYAVESYAQHDYWSQFDVQPYTAEDFEY